MNSFFLIRRGTDREINSFFSEVSPQKKSFSLRCHFFSIELPDIIEEPITFITGKVYKILKLFFTINQ